MKNHVPLIEYHHPVEAVAQDHNYATERLSLALAEAEELDDFLRQMKNSSELLGRFFWCSSEGMNLVVSGVQLSLFGRDNIWFLIAECHRRSRWAVK